MFQRARRQVRRALSLFTDEKGQAMVEYAVLLVLISVVVLVTVMLLGNQVKNVFCNISGGLSVITRGPG